MRSGEPKNRLYMEETVPFVQQTAQYFVLWR